MRELKPVFRALAARRRRLALACLTEHRLLTLADLAEEVTERETGTSVASLPAERVANTYFSLYHTHIPKLETAELVRYDQDDDLVERTEWTVQALDRAREALETMVEE